MSKHEIIVLPYDKKIEVDESETLLEALRNNDLYVKSSCGGHASCSDCIVKIVNGEDSISTPSFEELSLLGNVFHITKERLSCQTKITGPITIDITSHDKAKDQKTLKSKNKQFLKTKVRKKDEVETILTERVAQKMEKDKAREDKKNSWEKHWEKGVDQASQKKLGGNKRPKAFKTDHLKDDDSES